MKTFNQKPQSLTDLKKQWCDHTDTITLTRLDLKPTGFDVKETFCLTCNKTTQMTYASTRQTTCATRTNQVLNQQKPTENDANKTRTQNAKPTEKQDKTKLISIDEPPRESQTLNATSQRGTRIKTGKLRSKTNCRTIQQQKNNTYKLTLNSLLQRTNEK